MERHEIITSTYEEIESKVIHNNYTIIDDHTGENVKPLGIVLLENGEVAALLNHRCYCLNALYIKDDNVHLSKKSVGGVIVKNDIDRYNAECSNKIQYVFLF